MVSVEYGATADELLALYREYDWWADRDPEAVGRALEHTDEVVVLRGDDGDPEPLRWRIHRHDDGENEES